MLSSLAGAINRKCVTFEEKTKKQLHVTRSYTKMRGLENRPHAHTFPCYDIHICIILLFTWEKSASRKIDFPPQLHDMMNTENLLTFPIRALTAIITLYCRRWSCRSRRHHLHGVAPLKTFNCDFFATWVCTKCEWFWELVFRLIKLWVEYGWVCVCMCIWVEVYSFNACAQVLIIHN